MAVLAGSTADISATPVEVFNEFRVEFLVQLSRRLLSDPVGRVMPDVVTFAYWCRRANLRRMREAYSLDRQLRIGLGLTFHICPANVPVNFAYSMAFGLLAGNSCVLRLPSKESDSATLLVQAINAQLADPSHLAMRQVLLLLRFERDDDLSRFWISAADGRVVWGGDETVAHMRTFQSKPRSREVAFPDRYSLCVIDPVSVLQMEESALSLFCQDLFNDIYLMDQAACSSPQLIAWIGGHEDVSRAQARLWPEVVKIAKEKYTLGTVDVMDKFVQACRSTLNNENVERISRHENVLYRIFLSSVNADQDKCRGHFGTVYEVTLPKLDALAPIVNERYQTMTTQGISNSAIREWIVRNGLRGIDRVVPVGRALDMDIVWDGYDMVGSLSRLVKI
jgi:hypothetical protein